MLFIYHIALLALCVITQFVTRFWSHWRSLQQTSPPPNTAESFPASTTLQKTWGASSVPSASRLSTRCPSHARPGKEMGREFLGLTTTSCSMPPLSCWPYLQGLDGPRWPPKSWTSRYRRKRGDFTASAATPGPYPSISRPRATEARR